ncbi:MAG: transposase [Myxococcales bacterium]|nr:transposase [Myxococcales bacterium]
MEKNIREKSHRLPRQCYIGMVAVSFTACEVNQKPVFESSAITNFSISALRWAIEKNNCLALIYCFMPDHLHVILQGKNEHADTYKAFIQFKQKTGFFLRHSPYKWQKDFYDHVIRCQKQLDILLRYIAENPIRKGLVTHWNDYPFTGSIGLDSDAISDAFL